MEMVWARTLRASNPRKARYGNPQAKPRNMSRRDFNAKVEDGGKFIALSLIYISEFVSHKETAAVSLPRSYFDLRFGFS